MTNTSSEKTTVNSPSNLSDQDLLSLQQNPAYQALSDKSAVVGISEDGKPVIDVGRMVFKTPKTSPHPETAYKTFSCELTAFLKDSNAYGNVYFSRYFEWQGVCREKWFSECIVENMFTLDGVLITKNAHIDYYHELFPFQKITATLQTQNIKKASFEIIITFFDQNNLLVASGYQTIVFANKMKKICRLPAEIAEKISLYQKL